MWVEFLARKHLYCTGNLSNAGLLVWVGFDNFLHTYILQMVCIFKLTLNNDRKVTPPPFIYGFAQDFIQFECLFVRELSSNPFLQYWFVEIFENIPTNLLQYICILLCHMVWRECKHILYSNQISNSLTFLSDKWCQLCTQN